MSAITTVNIDLTDVNDNAPVFSRGIYTAVVSEDATVGESVVQVRLQRLELSWHVCGKRENGSGLEVLCDCLVRLC